MKPATRPTAPERAGQRGHAVFIEHLAPVRGPRALPCAAAFRVLAGDGVADVRRDAGRQRRPGHARFPPWDAAMSLGAMGRLGAESVRRSAVWLLESDLPLPDLSEAALHLHVLAGLDGGDGVVR